MQSPSSNIHAKRVEAWEAANAQGMASDELVTLFSKAIRAIDQRSRTTLSTITMAVVGDRALHESMERYPILGEIKCAREGFNFTGLLERCDSYQPDELRPALRALLVELLSLLGNITADILSEPLHRELTATTRDLALVSPSEKKSANPVKKLNRDGHGN